MTPYSTGTATPADGDEFVNIYENRVAGATANPLMPDPNEHDEAFAIAANRALRDAAELVRRIIPSHQSAVGVMVDGDWTTLRKFFSLSPKYRQWADYATPATGYGTHGWLLKQTGSVRFTQQELEAHPEWKGFGNQASAHPPMRGWLATQIIDSHGVHWGLIQLSDRETGDYTQHDEDTLNQFADLIALALEALWDVRNLQVDAAHEAAASH
jgi:GAF domain-containing protein